MTPIRYLALACLALLAIPAVAAQPGDTPREAQRQELLESLTRGPGFTSEGVAYQLLPELRVVRAHRHETPGQLLPRVGARDSDLVERKGSLLYFRRATRDLTAARAEMVSQRQLLPAAIDTRSGALVMLPGTIVTTPKDMAQARQIASDHGLTLTGDFPHLNLAVYKTRPGQDLLAAAQALSRDARLSRAEPEVITTLREPR